MTEPIDFIVDAIAQDSIMIWYGGPFKARAIGKFTGNKKVTLLVNVRWPSGDDIRSYFDTALHPEQEWILLKTFDKEETFEVDHLNPCALRAKLDGCTCRPDSELELL